MYKDVLRSIENIEIWPTISLIIFFLLFIGVLIYVIRSDNDFIRKMKKMPLDDSTSKDQDENNGQEQEQEQNNTNETKAKNT